MLQQKIINPSSLQLYFVVKSQHNMNQNNPQISLQEKYAFVLANRARFNAIEAKTIAELQAFASNCKTSSFAFHRAVQLETFYKCCRPAFQSLNWEEEINYKVAYPVANVVAFRSNDEKNYLVDQKVATWMESGGVRLMPIKSSLSKQKIRQVLLSSHVLFIPEYEGEPQIEFFDAIVDIIKENIDYPVLALGNSALMLLSQINNCQQIRKKSAMDLKFHNAQMTVFVSHEDRLFKDLDLKIRLQIENKARVVSSSVHLPVQLISLCKNQKLELIGVGKGRIDEWTVVVARQDLIHFCFVDPRQSGNNLDHVGFVHKLIVNFMEEVRKRQRPIQQKGLQLGQFKVILKGDRYFYNIDSKLPKI